MEIKVYTEQGDYIVSLGQQVIVPRVGEYISFTNTYSPSNSSRYKVVTVNYDYIKLIIILLVQPS